ncbi:DUF58 domain-containing protein [Marinicrinis lubricantis]|uniref:DUF58 domain-containing protein n=1 Tax=Marinicrinis lubricantis TaxID=2086470 RepID=A0ABW1IUV1_9BACL
MTVYKTGAVVSDKSRLSIVVIVWLSSFLFVLFQGGKLAFMLFLIATILSIYILMGRWSGIRSAQCTRRLLLNDKDQVIHAGQSMQVEVDIHIPGMWPLLYVLVKDQLRANNGDRFVFDSTVVPNFKRKGTLRYTTPPLRRGVYHFEETICSTEDIFGFLEHQSATRTEQTFKVMPRTVTIANWEAQDRAARGIHHQAASTQMLRETTQFDGVRDYVYGDRLSRIHWGASAKTGNWKSKEYEKEAMPRLLLVLDHSKASYTKGEIFETAVSTAASILKYAWSKGIDHSLYVHGLKHKPHYMPKFGRGREHYSAMMDQLVDIQPTNAALFTQTMTELPEILLHNSMVVIVTERSDEQLADACRLLRLKSAAVCSIAVGEKDSNVSQKGQTASQPGLNQEFIAYRIDSLEQLPYVLGGR